MIQVPIWLRLILLLKTSVETDYRIPLRWNILLLFTGERLRHKCVKVIQTLESCSQLYSIQLLSKQPKTRDWQRDQHSFIHSGELITTTGSDYSRELLFGLMLGELLQEHSSGEILMFSLKELSTDITIISHSQYIINTNKMLISLLDKIDLSNNTFLYLSAHVYLFNISRKQFASFVSLTLHVYSNYYCILI